MFLQLGCQQEYWDSDKYDCYALRFRTWLMRNLKFDLSEKNRKEIPDLFVLERTNQRVALSDTFGCAREYGTTVLTYYDYWPVAHLERWIRICWKPLFLNVSTGNGANIHWSLFCTEKKEGTALECVEVNNEDTECSLITVKTSQGRITITLLPGLSGGKRSILITNRDVEEPSNTREGCPRFGTSCNGEWGTMFCRDMKPEEWIHGIS